MTDGTAEPEHVREPEHAEADEDDVLAGDREQVVETRRLEGVAEIGVDALVGAEHDADDERPALTGRAERQCIRDFRAQPIAHATDPAPPADDMPGAARVQDDVDPTPLEPPSLVEAGLGPSRGDRARPEIEHGTLRRRPAGGKLEQHPLAQLDAVEAPHVCRDPHRERRDGSRHP